MALVTYDRVQETTSTTGTGSITLSGAVSGFQSFAVVGNGNTTYYTILNGTQWEVGLGTYSTTGPTLARTTIIASSNSGSAITLSGGSSVWCDYPAEKAIYYDANGTATIGSVLGYSDTGIIASFASTVAGYNQVILQNKSSATNASTNFNVSNDTATATTGFAELGINSSTFSNGAGAFNIAGAAYLASSSTDLAIGTYGAFNLHFLTNSNTVDSMTIFNDGGASLGGLGDPGIGNIAINNAVVGFTAITSAAGTTVLTSASTQVQAVTGTNTQTVQLPNATTLLKGTFYTISNSSTGLVTVKDNASTTLETIPSGGAAQFLCIANGTSAGTWGVRVFAASNTTWGTSALNYTGSITGATWAGSTVGTAYGGTGITGFSAANNAIYSTSSSALTAGTLPVAAGGTGVTTSTGSGSVVLSTSPTLTTPNLGTPSALVGTNITGTAAGLSIGGNAATATSATSATTANALNTANNYQVAGLTATSYLKVPSTSNPIVQLIANNQTSAFNCALVNNWAAGSNGGVLVGTSEAAGTALVVSNSIPITSGLPTGIGTSLLTVAVTGSTFSTGVTASSFSGAGTGLTGTAAGLSIGGNAATTSQTNFSNLTIGGSQVLDAANYNSYAPTLTGTGASGTWGISITGNAATASNGGVTSATAVAGTGISISALTTTGAATHTITNTGVTSAVASTGISVSGSTGAVTFTNTGVTSVLAGTGITVSGATGAVTISASSSGATVTPTTTSATYYLVGTTSTSGTLSTASISNTNAVYYNASTGALTAVSHVSSSDERLKTNWKNLPVDFISALSQVKYGTFERISSGNREAGVTAQSLKNALPEAVIENEDGMLSVNYGGAALVAAIELAKEVKALRAEINALKAR